MYHPFLEALKGVALFVLVVTVVFVIPLVLGNLARFAGAN